MELVRLYTENDPRYPAARALYEASFPWHEQREDAAQQRALLLPDYHFTLLCDGARFVGLALFWDSSDFLYVEHLCIQPDLRGHGYGQQLLRRLTSAGKPVILEIDPPVDAVSIRRKHFYTRAGFLENPWPHVHPPYHSGCAGHPLLLLSAPAALSEPQYRQFAQYLNTRVMNLSPLEGRQTL